MILKKGVLYPCQAVFLGAKISMLPHSVPLSWFLQDSNGRAEAPAYVIVEGGGVLVNERIGSAEYANLVGLMEIVQRVEEFAPLNYLTTAEIASVLDGGTHGYRAVGMATTGNSHTLSQTGLSSMPDPTRQH
jgi:hypothetical protein